MDFDGVNDSIATGYSYDAAVTPNFSLSFWFKTTSTALFEFPVSIKTNGGGYTSAIVMMYGDNLLIQDRTGWVFGTNQSINDGNWHNVIVTAAYSGNTTDGTLLNMYLDGNLTPDLTSANMNSGTNSYLDGDLYIGSYNGASNFYDCSVDEVAVWESILTSGNITSINTDSKPNDLTSLSPVSWWRMGEDATFSTVWTIPDQIGSNNGTSANMTNDDLTGDAPGVTGNGVSANMTIEDRTGDAPDSSNNALSYNMDAADIVEDTPPN
tara:strand:- start:65 stop:865 length:801 start_codon:yes stop_codon:yes gene_type:complete